MYEVRLDVEDKILTGGIGNTEAFPKDWLMLYRWGKRRKGEKQKTADGYEVDHVTVGGRTACYVPALQKKSASSLSESTASKLSKTKVKSETSEPAKPTKAKSPKSRAKKPKVEEESGDNLDDDGEEAHPPAKKGRTTRRSQRNNL
ncbi:hypothetical protein AWJ20_656 [Sugiyamaella lignohabitans]|uniref:Uncharacterized protein n=1 Tax=Sugiyamaella lignohabitans TaxID=796027 RepID=A0A167D2P9_9ASCO|nr:uncharacterized protein AWJ20_656 [Sugiyamaella lignohabitans]ANB12403.1 hypothetical protein AWJ20_656 [Sugiyamaella lignohabitans]